MIGLANWTPDSFVGQLFKTIGDYIPPPAGVKSPALWGTRTRLDELFGNATEAECDFIRRLLTGELRQGALAGIMVDAVSRAAAVPAELVRRALMLSGDLPATAATAISAGEEGLLAVGFELFQPVLPMLASTAESVM